MNLLKKGFCVLLCFIMAFSCTNIAFAAEEKNTDFTYSMKYYTGKDDSYNADILLDTADKILKELNIVETVEITLLFIPIRISVELTSIDAICQTIDTFAPLLNYSKNILYPVMGDIADLDLSSWQTGMRRGSQDIKIIKELLELAKENKEIVSKLCDGTIDIGVFDTIIDLEERIGVDGVAGFVKRFIIGLVHEEGTAEFDKAYSTYKNNMDAFIYGDFLSKYAEEYLPGFTMDESSTVEDLICIAFGLIVDKYIVPLVKDINIDLEATEYDDLKKLHGIVNLNGESFDFSEINLDPAKPFLSQVNDLVGKIFTQLIPGYTWKTGSYDKISENIEGAFKYLGKASGLISGADALSFDEIVMEIIAIILRNVDLGGLDEGVTECKTLEDMLKVALINAANQLSIGTSYTDSDSYLLVMGDIAAWWLYNNFNVTTLDGKALRAGMGYDVFEVANFALNYLLFDKQLQQSLAASNISKNDTIFQKTDKLLDYFGETKNKGVSFDSKKFLFGDGKTKGLIDSIFSLDIENIIEITAVPALRTAGNVSAVEFIYKTIQYALNNWSGKTMIPAYRKGAFANALSNENIAVLAKVLLETANIRKDYIIRFIGFLGGMLLKGEPIVLGTPSVKIEDTEYTGKAATPKATVILGGKTLTQGQDFIVATTDVQVGKATGTIKGIGLYKGESAPVSFNIKFGAVSDLKAASDSSSATFTWKAVPGASKYNVYLDGVRSETVKTAITFNDLKAGKTYTFGVEAVSSSGEVSKRAYIMAKIIPGKVEGLSAESTTKNSVNLSWKATNEATSYFIEANINGAWTKTYTTTNTSYTVSGLSSGTDYKFRVRAVVSGAYSEYSDTVSATTKPAKVTSLKAKTKTATSVTLSWSKVSGADKYYVQRYTNGEWKNVKSTTSTSYKVSSLSAGTSYKFRVRAYSSKSGYGEYSSELSAATNLKKVTGVSASTKTASTVTLKWSKVSGATQYIVYKYSGGEWVELTKTSKTSYKVSKLSGATVYKFKVKAYSSKLKVYGEDSATFSVRTLPGTVSGLKASKTTASSVTLKWSKVSGATGYVVYRSTDGKKWTKIGTASKNTITAKSLKKNTKYQFKVRAYKKVSGTTYYGAYSTILKVKTPSK